MLLACAGVDVTIYEGRSQVGGRSETLTAQTQRGTFKFDRGPTFFLYPRILEEIFAACGRTLRDEVELLRIEPQYRLIFGDGGHIDASGDIQRMASEIARFSPEDAAALPAFMADNRAKLNLFQPVLQNEFNRLSRFLSPDLLRALPLLRPFRSVDQDLQRHFSDPKVRLAFTFQSKYLGMSPFRCPSLFSILSFMEYEYGIWHPRGGCGAIMTRMAAIAQQLGVRLRLNEPVTSLGFEGRRVTGVGTANGTQEADAVVINADFAQTMTRLVPDRLRRRWTDARLAKKKFSCSTFMLYLGIKGPIPQLPHHTIYLANDYQRNIAEIEGGIDIPSEASIYVQNAGVTDDTLAPPGHTTLYVLVPVGHLHPDGVDWSTARHSLRQQVFARLARLGLTDLQDRIVWEHVVTPNDWQDELQIFRGATFNLAHSIGQMLYFRPHNRFEDLQGVYLVGGGTHPGSGLPVIFESARITARLIAKDFAVRPLPAPHPFAAPNPEIAPSEIAPSEIAV
jgi:phytoene desaturase